MNTRVNKRQENKSQSVANEVSHVHGSGESAFQFVDNRAEVVAQRKLQEITKRYSKPKEGKSSIIQPKWLDSEGESLIWDSLIEGVRWFYLKDSSQMYYLVTDGADTYQVNAGIENARSREKWIDLHGGEDSLAHLDASVIPSDHIEGLSNPITYARLLAQEVAPSSGMDCDRWARDFQQKLIENSIKFTPRIVLVRPNKRLGALAVNAHIKIGGNIIGNDSHFYTVVEGFVFDNIYVGGIEGTIHKGSMSYWLNDPEEEQEEGSVVIRYSLPATAVLDLHPAAAIRKDKADKKK